MKPLLIITVGYPGSGKSTLVAQVVKRFSDIIHIDSDAFRDFLLDHVSYFSGIDLVASNEDTLEKREMITGLVGQYRESLALKLLNNGISVVVDGNHLTMKRRQQWRDLIERCDRPVTFMIISLIVPEEELLERLKQRELVDGRPWVQGHMNQRKGMLEPVDDNEANIVVAMQPNEINNVIQLIQEQ